MTVPNQPVPTRSAFDELSEALLPPLLAFFFGTLALTWVTGCVAAAIGRGRRLGADVGDVASAVAHLPTHLADPRQAWPEPARSNLPGPVVYFLATAVVINLVVVGVMWWLERRGDRDAPTADRRKRLGVDTQARLARNAELRPLLSRQPQPNRFLLARLGRQYVSTEGPGSSRRRGVAGAVAVFGPSQSGKTTGLIEGTNAWSGPAIVSSVKTDLYRRTLVSRSERGEVKVFDPLGLTGAPTATWSPLRAAASLPHALAAAQLLARVGSDDTPSDKFWRGQAEQLIAAMLWTASNTEGKSMRDVVRWVLELDRPDEGATTGGELAPLVRLLADHADPTVALAAGQVRGWLHGQWNTDPRTTSSVYATARTAVWPWADPQIAASADGCDLTLEWILRGANTLYLVAPLGDEHRVGVVFSILLHDLVSQAFDRVNRTGEALDPRLLVLLDEAANTPLPKLPEWASTVTGAGLQLVTVWQSKAQLDQTYHQDADTVLTNHRTKLIYPSGLSDLATVEYVSRLVGNEHIRSDLDRPVGIARLAGGGSGVPPERSPGTSVPFLPASVLRQVRPGDRLLVHGHLPPAWLPMRGRG